MLAARGVSLGLGKINLSDLNQLPHNRILAAQLKKSNEKKNKKPKIIIKKKADAKVKLVKVKEPGTSIDKNQSTRSFMVFLNFSMTGERGVILTTKFN